jgi:hypothetical protein
MDDSRPIIPAWARDLGLAPGTAVVAVFKATAARAFTVGEEVSREQR